MISKAQQKKIAKERIEILFQQAKASKNPSLSNRYVTLARKLSMKYKVKIPVKYKRLVCKKCYKYLVPGKTLTIRTKNKRLTYTCKYCNHVYRRPLK